MLTAVFVVYSKRLAASMMQLSSPGAFGTSAMHNTDVYLCSLNFAVQECFPYLARRLLADDNPRIRTALRDVLYGGRSRLDVQRLIKMSDAFSAYTTDGLEGNAAGAAAAAPARPAVAATQQQQQQRPAQQEPALSPAAKDAMLAVFSRRGSYVQELLVEELVAAADALSRDALSQTLRVLLGSAPVAVVMSSLEALGPLRPLLLPLTTPLELLSRLAPAVQLTDEDEEALGVVRGIFQLVARMSPDSPAAAAAAATGSSAGYRSVGSADAGNAASGMVFSTTEESRGQLRGLAAAGRVDPGAAVAAAAEAVNGAAGVARELQPILPELIPGLQYTGELFVHAFVRRVALRLAESFTVADSNGSSSSSVSVDDEERALAMAALGFVAGPDSFKRIGSVGLPAGFGSSSNGVAMTGSSSVAREFAGVLFQQQQQQGLGAGFGAAKPLHFQAPPGSAASSAAGGWGSGPLTAGLLVTGLVAAPLLAVLTPLAALNELQRRQQRDRQ
jgi:aarF domain-containing kinase